MKNKRIVLSILAIALVACIACVAVACGEKDKDAYTVSFGGEGVSGISSQTVKSGECAQKPQDPQRDGYEFKGWAEEGQSTLFDFSTPITKDTALVAVWEENGTLTVSFGGEGVSDVPSQTVKSGECAQKPQDPQRNGYEFKGWSEEGQSTLFDFSTPITKDTVLVAAWTELGSKDNPYLIATADDLADFADKVNHPDEDGNEKYAQSYFKLVADIDMNGIPYVSAGQLVTLNEGEEDERKIYGFSGNFDGDGHVISNLTIKKNLRSGISYVGMFGYCDRATITNLTLQNVRYSIVSGADQSGIGAYVGGLLAYGNLTNITNVKVSGDLEISLCSSNPAHIGGIAGGLDVYDKSTAYIAHVQNCVSEVRVVATEFEDGEASVLDSAVNGGIIGATSSTSNGALAVLNCVSNGAVEGGEWVGGIVGYASCSRMSIINCVNYARVKATDKEVSYAGGIIGYSSNDNTIMDCVNAGAVTGQRATSTVFKSYAGSIVGYMFSDDYDGYYTPGTVVVNCYYKTAARTTDINNKAGTKIGTDVTLDSQWFAQNVKWDMSNWTINEDGKAYPGTRLVGEGSFKISFYNGTTLVSEETREYDENGFAIVGSLDKAQNDGSKLFFDWEFVDGVRYRYYVPVIKDMSVTARYGDASKVAHVYTGKGEYHGDVDGGVLVLKEDGSLMWVNSTVINGKYTYNDDDVLMLEFYSTIGEISGKLNSDGTITMTVEYGMSATVEYTFTKSDLTVFGEYFNEDGDSLTFTDGNVTLTSNRITATVSKTVSGTYVLNADGSISFGGELADYFTSMSGSYANDAITVSLVAKDASKVPSYTNSTFARPDTDFRGKAFVGSFTLSYLGLSSNRPTQNNYTLIFNEDGSFIYRTAFYDTTGAYYSFKNDSFIKINYEGNYSTFYYYPEENVFFGRWNSGTTAYTYCVLTKVDEGAQTVYLIDFDTKSFLAVTESGKVYYVKDGQYVENANIVAPDGFKDGTRVTIDGKAYYAKKYVTYNNGKELLGHGLESIGSEEGAYLYNGRTYTLNGIGGVVEDAKARYWKYGNNFIVMMLSDRSFIGFDYTQAQANGGRITLVAPYKYQGVWCGDKTVKVLDENLNETGETRVIEKYYLLMFDGYGHAAYVYLSDEEKAEYKDNWGKPNIWRTASENSTGLHVEFNENYKIDFLFFYDMNLAYTKKFGVYGEMTYYKYGYTGTKELPKLPSSAVGSYTGNESNGTAVVFNLKQDLTGTYKGVPFIAVYDGVKNVSFTIASTRYSFDVTAKAISYGDENVSLTRTGDVTEVIPEALCGTWEGAWEGYGTGSGSAVRRFEIKSTGEFVYQDSATGMLSVVSQDSDKIVLSVVATTSNTTYTFKLTYNINTKNFSAKADYVYDQETRVIECSSLTKVTE